MSTPQQPELARSRKTPGQDPDAVAGALEAQRDLGTDAPRGPVPPENQPGHHPPEEQDKPDPSAFAARLGTAGPDGAPSPDATPRAGGQEGQSSPPASPSAPAPAASSPAPVRRGAIFRAAGLVGFLLLLRLVRRRRSRR